MASLFSSRLASTTTGEEGSGADVVERASDMNNSVPSPLKGLVVWVDGIVENRDGKPVGQIVKGDPGALIGFEVRENGEILDDDGDVIGRASLRAMPPIVSEQHTGNRWAGLKVDPDGDILGIVTKGLRAELTGFGIDRVGYVVDGRGERVGETMLLEQIRLNRSSYCGDLVHVRTRRCSLSRYDVFR
ncbi:hypothetical protein OEA41_009122 [Lepraria neglecta]|uniref:Uncharacterized protein n=1 Tax=Lepraria neglecta TaxID=209136 RepID=A0AAE0DJX3_9LECA|nr:hypothetical protein OEA41_009122 [Lepraria neglecta]